jgi:hypothetical protein
LLLLLLSARSSKRSGTRASSSSANTREASTRTLRRLWTPSSLRRPGRALARSRIERVLPGQVLAFSRESLPILTDDLLDRHGRSGSLGRLHECSGRRGRAMLRLLVRRGGRGAIALLRSHTISDRSWRTWALAQRRWCRATTRCRATSTLSQAQVRQCLRDRIGRFV